MKKENIPNALTLIRVVMIPIFIAILSLSHSYLGHIVAAVIFAIASITDYLDGFLARKWNVVSNFGKFADPMADKLLVMSVDNPKIIERLGLLSQPLLFLKKYFPQKF